MKKTSDDLFRLIKSLSKSEKGYFKKFAKRYSGPDNNSIKLYNAIEKQADAGDVYDEESIKKQYAKEAFAKQLGVTKIYLYNLVLKSLDQYYSEENERARLTELLSQIRILEKKALYKQCHKLIKKAKEIAYKHEIMPRILDLLIIERKLTISGPAKDQAPRIQEVYNEQMQYLDKLDKYLNYTWLSDRMAILAEKRSEIEDDVRAKEIEEIRHHPLLASDEIPNTHFAKSHFYNIHILYCLSKNDFKCAQELLKKQIAFDETVPERINEYPRNYIISLLNYLLFSNVVGREDDVKEALKKVDLMRAKFKNKISRDLEITISIHAVNIEVFMYNKAGDTANSKVAIQKAEQLLEEYGTDMPYEFRITVFYNLTTGYFLLGDYDNALRVMNELLNSFSGDIKPEIYTFAKIFNLIIHLELKHNELLEYIANTTYRFLKERKKLYKTETLFLKLIREILQAKDSNERLEAYKEFRFGILQLKDDQPEKRAFEYFNFIAWSESKVTGRPMVEIIANKKKLHEEVLG